MSSDHRHDASAAELVLDERALARLRELDPSGRQGLLRRVMTTYLGSLGRLRAQIADGLATGDHAGVRMGAHTLKSSSASVGALELSRLCAALESAARDGRVHELPKMVEQVQQEVGRVHQAVDRLVAG